MSKEMIISVNGREKKIAIVDNGRVTEFYIERGEENSGVVGNIYKGRVQRVLPGMQSAFVDIGLERDAFLYVSDFFDEEEEIERIVMEKSKKGSAEDAKREAVETVERKRLEREHKIEDAQELAEPLAESAAAGDAPSAADDEPAAAQAEAAGRRGRRGRGKRGEKETREGSKAASQHDDRSRAETGDAKTAEATATAAAGASGSLFDLEDSGFERVVDDDAETGEIFKDAYRQEAIIDRVRAVEFDIESTAEAPVGSLLGEVAAAASGFERIADEDETAAAPAETTEKPKRKGRSKKDAAAAPEAAEPVKEKASRRKTKTAEPDETVDAAAATEKKGRAKSTRSSSSRGKKAAKSEPDSETVAETAAQPDAEANVTESIGDRAEMAVRRGGRGRRRGGRGRKNGDAPGGAKSDERFETAAVDEGGFDEHELTEVEFTPADEPAAAAAEDERPAEIPAEPARGEQTPREGRQSQQRDRERGGRQGRGSRGGDRRERGPQPTISDLLREGQEVLVQIAKEPIARKGARITSHIALPGRFLVYMPTIEHLGVSRKIESANERGRLRQLIQRIRQDPEITSGGFIVRTAGVGIAEEDLKNDAKYLVRTWLDIKKNSEKRRSPVLVHQDLDLVQRILRDQLSDDFSAIRVDNEEEYERTVEFLNRMAPRMVRRVKLYTREDPILEAYGVQEEIDKALKPRVWLKSGGYLVINQTEALVAIDVNTGKFVGKGNARLEDTITKTNLEAVDEIARQIRLRDLGGIIVLDLIDMEDRRNRQKVLQALQEALADDKSPTKVLSFNDFGLIIMTRKRVKQSLERTMCAPCEYCEGAGWVKSPTTVAYEILAEARRLSKTVDDVRQTTLRVHPDVARALHDEREVLDEVEAYLGNVDITADPTVHQAQFDFAFV
ncbi:MAG: Rne/Rng family ribonuclease [Pyrinomonadaceae bacterium]